MSFMAAPPALHHCTCGSNCTLVCKSNSETMFNTARKLIFACAKWAASAGTLEDFRELKIVFQATRAQPDRYYACNHQLLQMVCANGQNSHINANEYTYMPGFDVINLVFTICKARTQGFSQENLEMIGQLQAAVKTATERYEALEKIFHDAETSQSQERQSAKKTEDVLKQTISKLQEDLKQAETRQLKEKQIAQKAEDVLKETISKLQANLKQTENR
jgi:hypothetical protein